MPHEWDAAAYDALPLPHEDWGRRVLDRMRLRGDERVLDAGCGTGRDAAALLQRQPDVRLVCLDASERMLAQARERLGERAEFVRADLDQPLHLHEPVDAVMSVAAFHWVPDHDRLFAHLAAVMLPGARLTSDCGGQGQLSVLDAALVEVTGQPKIATAFKGVAETRASLDAAGFDVEDVRLREDPQRFQDAARLEAYLAAVNLSGYLADLPAEQHAAFVRRVREAMTEPVLDYVRLEIDAVRR